MANALVPEDIIIPDAAFKTVAGRTFVDIDEITSAAFVAKTWPRDYLEWKIQKEQMEAQFEDNATIRNTGRTVGMSKGNSLMMAGMWPPKVDLLLRSLAPDIFFDPKQLEAWINRHPEYKIGRSTTR